MEKENVINKRVIDLNKGSDMIQTIIIFLVALLVPTFLGELITKVFSSTSVIAANSQIIIGTIVNMALVTTALNLKGWSKIIGVVTMPSIATILGGYVFETASTYMIYMIPAIWVGNFALIYCYKYFMLEKNINYFLAGSIGIIIKVAVIFLFFSTLNVFGVFPSKLISNLQTAMGITQLITAICGVLISFAIYKLENKNEKN